MSDTPRDTDRDLGALAALAEPVRRTLYRYVCAREEGASRDQAAAGVGVAHHIAKFHLDRLEADGLLETEYRRPAGRAGPGAGRPAKIYRRAEQEIALSLPERRYDLAAHLLAEAVTTSERDGMAVSEAVRVAAAAAGHAMAGAARERASGTPEAADLLRDALEHCGYEPHTTDRTITLRNCPFHALAAEHTALVCGMNLDLISAAIDELDTAGLRARLSPSPGRCCVAIQQS